MPRSSSHGPASSSPPAASTLSLAARRARSLPAAASPRAATPSAPPAPAPATARPSSRPSTTTAASRSSSRSTRTATASCGPSGSRTTASASSPASDAPSPRAARSPSRRRITEPGRHGHDRRPGHQRSRPARSAAPSSTSDHRPSASTPSQCRPPRTSAVGVDGLCRRLRSDRADPSYLSSPAMTGHQRRSSPWSVELGSVVGCRWSSWQVRPCCWPPVEHRAGLRRRPRKHRRRRQPGETGEAYEVDTATDATLGAILVGEDGMTLYIFKKDSGGKSACNGDCATKWPPFVLEEDETVTAGDGVTGHPGHDRPRRRLDAGHVQRRAALLLRGRHRGRRRQGPGPQRRLVRGHAHRVRLRAARRHRAGTSTRAGAVGASATP